jgi:putative transposase
MLRPLYPTDLTDRQWAAIEARIPPPRRRRRRVNMREVVNAILYRCRHGCPWRLLPADLPAWQTVHEYFRTWRDDGTWARIEEAMNEASPMSCC